MKMEMLPEFDAEEDIEEWLEIFECRAACAKITNERTKIQWCRGVIGSVGRCILRGLLERGDWDEAKEELRRYLGEADPRGAVWKKLRGYQANGKSYGEIASEVRDLAVRAADEEDVLERLAVEAFLGAIPWPFPREIKLKETGNLREALKEAKIRKAVEEDLRRGKEERGLYSYRAGGGGGWRL